MIKTIIIGAGYIGLALLHHLDNDPNRTVCVTSTTIEKIQTLSSQGIQAFLIDCTDTQALEFLLKGAEEVVVCVAPSHGRGYQETYLNTAQNLSQILTNHATVKRLICLSSTSVYGEKGGEWVDESTSLKPENPNTQVLLEAEKTYLQIPEINVAILRLAGIYGPGREHTKRLIAMNGHEIPGSSKAFVNWAHQEDIVRAIHWAFTRNLTGVYNVCATDHPTKGEFYHMVAQLAGCPPPKFNPQLKVVHGGNRRVSNEKLRQTGFQFLHKSID